MVEQSHILTGEQNSVRATLRQPELTWQEELRTAVRKTDVLRQKLSLASDNSLSAELAANEFPLFVTSSYLEKIRPGDPDDPLLRQVLPLRDEIDFAGFETPTPSADPLEEKEFAPIPGLLHKYEGRALLITTGACAIHCRYCFRRHFPYESAPRTTEQWQSVWNWLKAHPEINEIILSGGDPLMLTDGALAQLFEKISHLPQMRRVRIHTRLPIMIPQRITNELVTSLRETALGKIVVVHANHPRELCHRVGDAIQRLVAAGVVVLNQAVLLKGVNDSFSVQRELCERLIDLQIIPYYLHQLDSVKGAMHFFVPIEKGRAIMQQLRQTLPGYAVPRYVCELPGEASKTPID